MAEENSIKNRVVLSDYAFQRDIENRLFMTELTVEEIEVLREVLDSPLKVSVSQIAANLNISKDKVITILQKLMKSKLFSVEGDFIFVDKDMRKYFELHLQKFEEEFVPDMDFLQGLLNAIPIHVLPGWYELPSTSNQIFKGIVENYLLTPKVYERYLKDLRFEDPVLNQIMKEVLGAPGFKIQSKELMHKYALTMNQLEKCILMLEYSLVCSQRFCRVGNQWEGVVTAFQEWQEYVSFQKKTIPTSVAKVEKENVSDFCFVEDLEKLIELLSGGENKTKSQNSVEVVLKLLEKTTIVPRYTQKYVERMIRALHWMDILADEKGVLKITETAKVWLRKSVQEQAATLYRAILLKSDGKYNPFAPYVSRDFREIERGLKRVLKLGWISFEDFLKGLTAAVGQHPQVQLQNRGRRWKYVLPNYSEADVAFIRKVIFEIFFEAGITSIGMCEGRECFCVTPFGRGLIGE